MVAQERSVSLDVLFIAFENLFGIELAVLLGVVKSFWEWFKLCFDILDIKGPILVFDVFVIFDVLVFLMMIDFFDFKEPVDFIIVAVLLINIFVVIFLLEQHIPQPSLHFILYIISHR